MQQLTPEAGRELEPAEPVPRGNITTDSGPPQRLPELTAQANQSPADKGVSPSGSEPEPQAEPSLPPARSPSARACEPFRELIELGLARGRNAMAIWQDWVSQAGFASGYPSLKRFIRRLRGTQAPEAHPVIVTAPS